MRETPIELVSVTQSLSSSVNRVQSETPSEPVSEDTTRLISTPLHVDTLFTDLRNRVSALKTGLSSMQTTLKEVKDNQLAQKHKFNDQMEFLTGLMQQILDKLTSDQPSQDAPSKK